MTAHQGSKYIAIRRRSYLFSASGAGGERVAAMHNLIDSCKLNKIDPKGSR